MAVVQNQGPFGELIILVFARSDRSKFRAPGFERRPRSCLELPGDVCEGTHFTFITELPKGF